MHWMSSGNTCAVFTERMENIRRMDISSEKKCRSDGKVNYPVFIARLKEVGYDGDITIEREISGEEQKKDILAGKEYLEQLIG